jgi:hypothetical protein
VVEGIMAEWFAKQPEELRKAYFTNSIVHASMETLRAQLTVLYQALRAEGVHIWYCRRVINRVLYGVPEPDGVASLFDRMARLEGLDDSTFTLTGQLDPDAATALINEFAKLGVTKGKGAYGEEPLQVQQD